jgi:rsbT co-antagonist protein RsbR
MNGVITLLEGRALTNIGYQPGDLVGKNVFEAFRGDDDMLDKVRRALAGEEFVALIEVNGRTLENRYFPLRDESGSLFGASGVTFDVTDRINARQQIERQTQTTKEQEELLDLAHDAIMVRTFDGTITYWNRGAEQMYGYAKSEAIGQRKHLLLRTRFPKDVRELEREIIANGYWEGELTHARRDGAPVVVQSRWVLKRDARGEPSEVLEINTDITSRKEAEEARERKQEELIRAQALAIAELSTPLIPITDDILVMPIIGVMDSNRANQVMESLLGGLSSSRGTYAIIDITGVAVVDTQVANALIRAAQAAQLLGAKVILTGIRPEVAQTLVGIGADLGSITTRGTLQSGIAFAMGRRGWDEAGSRASARTVR